jgi:hypothetical protein
MASRSEGRSKRRGPEASAAEFLLLLPADTIKELKMTALSRDVTASSLLQSSIEAWLKRHGSAKAFSAKKIAAAEKRQFLSKMDAELIRSLKRLAIDWRTTASAIAAEAVLEFLSRKGISVKS